MELDLEKYYEQYVSRFRNLDYLEHELEKYHKAEEERKEEHDRKLKKMRERLRKEEVDLLRGEIAESGGPGSFGSKGRSPQAESKYDGAFGTRRPQSKVVDDDSDDDEEFPDDDDVSDDDSDLDTDSGSEEHF